MYGIVTRAGGNIKVYSEPGLGTTVRMYLPTAEEPQPTRERVVPAAPPRGNGESVFVVEDEEEVRRLVTRILDRDGYRVRSAATGPEAIALLGDDPGDLLLTDVVMPEMSGPRLAEAIRQRHPGLPVLYMSGYGDGQLNSQRLIEGDIELIQKPFTPRELLGRVHAVLHRPGTRTDPAGTPPPAQSPPPAQMQSF